MAFESYSIDQKAHDLVLRHLPNGVLKQAYKMRVTASYGLERFWGEQWRLEGAQREYWRETWETLVEIMENAGVHVPNDDVSSGEPAAIKDMAEKLWTFPVAEVETEEESESEAEKKRNAQKQKQRKVTLAVLMQLCDSLVWWTQRYKRFAGSEDNDETE